MPVACPRNDGPGLIQRGTGTRCGVVKPKQVARRPLKVARHDYAAEAGIKIDHKPMPLFQLLVLCMLASKPIDAAVAMSAAVRLTRH